MEERRIGPRNFVPIHKLGHGSFGQVYLVEKIRPDGTKSSKLYALKILSKR